MLPQTIFSGGISLICWLYFPCLLVNEEWAALHDHEALEICLLSWKSSPSAPRASRQERRENGAWRGNHFPSPFELFWIFWCYLAGMSWWMEWAGLPLWVWAWLMGVSHFFYIFAAVDHWAWWNLVLWQISGALDLVCCGPKKWASTFSPPSPDRMWCVVWVSIRGYMHPCMS